MIKKLARKRLITTLLLICIITGLINPINIKASVTDGSTSVAYVKNSEGERVLTITMESGEITIEAKSHAATNTVKWETIGLTVSKVPLEEDSYKYIASEATYYLDGWKNVSTIDTKNKATMWYKDGDKDPDDKSSGIVTSTVHFSAQRVSDALGDNFDDIKKGTTVYLNAIFDVYTEDANGNHKVKSGEDDIRNWKDILLAEYWDRSDNQLDDFAKFFNMPIQFQPQPVPQPNTLHYISEDKSIEFATEDLDSVVAGESVTWSTDQSEITYNKKIYGLVGYYITQKGSTTVIVSHSTDDGWPVSKIKAGSITVKKGGMDIYLEYREKSVATPTPTGKPTATPTPKVSAAPTPSPEPIPAADSKSMPLTSAFTTGQIRADNRGSEKFTATAGIPTTESLYGQVTAKEYLLGYTFVKKVGKITYSVPVRKSYIMSWESATPSSAGGSKPQQETVTVTQNVSVTRAYGYWEIVNLDYYNIDNAVLYNYALPDGKLTLKPRSSYYNPPSMSCYHTADTSYHIIPPDEVTNGITLTSETISGGTSKPGIPQQDFTSYALSQTGKIKVKSDSLTFGGKTVISDQITETEAPYVNTANLPQCNTNTNQNALYDNDQVIKATKLNGQYSSSGTITYRSIVGIGSSNPDMASYAISGLNDVVIHTPVLCDPIISADNDKYVQLITPQKDATELVLDPDQTLSDFTINISNTGFHTGIAGFFTRDFSKSLHDDAASYIMKDNGLLCNEVKFPFDVFIDKGNDKKTTNDDYIKAGTWIVLGRSTQRFYLPTWITEGIYTVNFRTIAVNGEDHMMNTESYANRDRTNYVATNTAKFEISGRIYGLTLYDISDYPMWKEAFRIPKSSDLKKNSSLYPDGTGKESYNKNYSYTYTVGTNDQYGNDTGRKIKYTFPLVNGSHPQYKNQGILKTGYLIRFSLDTIGNMFSDDTSVILKPSFYFVDKNGKNRTAVDIYYTENIGGKTKNLVKIGGQIDKTNIKSYNTGDLNLGIPESEMKLTAALRNTKYGNFFWQKSAMFTFAKVQLNYAFRTLIGQDYANSIKKLDSYDTVKTRVSENDVQKTLQRWYGQYYLPNDIHVVKKGYNVMDYAAKHGVRYNEDFWLKDGYIIINMNIYTIENGKQHLSYVNADNYQNNGNCSMWIMEGPPLSKTSNKGPSFSFYAGDFFIYYTNKKMSDDYSSGAIY